MKKFTANVLVDEKFTEERIQCVSTNETYNYSTVWVTPETGKKYIIYKMYHKSWFVEIMQGV